MNGKKTYFFGGALVAYNILVGLGIIAANPAIEHALEVLMGIGAAHKLDKLRQDLK